MTDPYEELGVPRDATPDQIKAAHRKGVKRTHPDGAGPDSSPEKFGALQKAYEVLADPERRARFDETGDASEDPVGRQQAAIMERVSRTLQSVIAAQDNLRTTDVAAHIRKHLEEVKKALKGNLAEADRLLARAEELKRRFHKGKRHYKKGVKPPPTGMVEAALDVHRASVLQAQAGAKREMDLHEQVMAVFAAMDYDFEAPPPKPPSSRFHDLGDVYAAFQEFGGASTRGRY